MTNDGDGLTDMPTTMTFSQDSAPTIPTGVGGYGLWYDTAYNIVKYTNNNGSSWMEYFSLPFAVVGPYYGYIKSVFNGFGFIGSTIWCDKGVKGLASDGRNSDGSLKNIEFETEYVTTNTRNWTVIAGLMQYVTISAATKGANAIIASYYFEQEEKPDITGHVLWFNTRENVMYWQNNDNTWIKVNNIKVFNINNTQAYTDGKIDSISEVKQPFRAVDYNDTGFIAHQAMPSPSSVNLSLPASGGTLVAPTDGYVYLGANTNNSNYAFIELKSHIANRCLSNNVTSYLHTFINVSKGDTVTVSYQNIKTNNKLVFKFIYANGSK